MRATSAGGGLSETNRRASLVEINFAVLGCLGQQLDGLLSVFHAAGMNFFAQHDFGIGIVQALVKFELRILRAAFRWSIR